MSSARYIVGDVFDVMAKLPDDSVDLVLTSPPFLALRSYLPADHPDKAKEIGSEPTPAEFLDTLLALTAEWGRVLTRTGSIAVELGDTYSGGGGENHLWDNGYSGGRTGNVTKKPKGSGRTRDTSQGWPLDKSLCIIPELYAASLAYGRNLLTGQPSPAGQWRVRNLVRWVRPNPPVGALGDKYRPATSTMVVACKARDRWFDLDAVRNDDVRAPSVQAPSPKALEHEALGHHGKGMPATGDFHANGGAPPLDWWQIPTEPYAGSHYATWPRRLCRIPIDSMCPRHVCTVCGEPRRRIVDVQRHGAQDNKGRNGRKVADVERIAETLGWSDCGHDNWRPGIVLDPFGGSGTTGAVATGLGRDCILIDLDARNADLAAERIGMFLTVEAAT